MKENKRVIGAFLSVFIIICTYGCSGMQKGSIKTKESGNKKESSLPFVEKNRTKAKEHFDTTNIRSLLMPVVRLSFFNLSLDYYEQFVWDEDTPFPEYIYYAFESSSDGYEEGVGTIVAEKNSYGEIQYVFERALLKINADDSMWWQIHQTTKYTTLFYEVLVSPEGVPLKIRTIHPQTGEYAEAVPRIAIQYTGEKGQVLMRLEREKAAEIEQEWDFLFYEPRIIGEETVDGETGAIESIRISDQLPDEELNIDYWVSAEVPGRFVKALYTTAFSETELTLELIQIRDGYKPHFGPLD